MEEYIMEEKRNNKKLLLTMVGVAILVIAFGVTTYAFFNYTRTGGSNIVRTGRISFSTSQQTINLTNLFPIDPTETGIMNDATKVGTLSITITGDTDYSEGIV